MSRSTSRPATRKPPVTARSVAAEILRKWEEEGGYSNRVLDAALGRATGLSEADRALVTVLSYGVLEKLTALDYNLSLLCDRPLSQLDPAVRRLLRLGLYQLQYLDRIPDHAALNETVALADRKTAGYINGVLRAWTRKKKDLPLPADPLERLAVETAIPLPLARALCDAYGEEKTASILHAFASGAGLTLRVNPLRTSREALLDIFRAAGLDASPTPYSPDGIRLPGGAPTALPGFEKGAFFVQDEASQLCVCALDPQPGDRILDCCACPGSKSFGAALKMQDRGSILACDLHENKLSLVQSGAQRLGISILSTAAQDGRAFRPEWEGAFDRVLCDVPCSGYGILAKKPEIRHKDPKSAAGLPAIQYDILTTAARYVTPGGCLVYSTCTLLPAENEEQVRRFLREHADFALAPFAAGSLPVPQGMKILLPDETGTDGFFFARLQRRP